MPDSHPPQAPRFDGATFALQDVRLDGVEFRRCRFEHSRLVFSGEALPRFTECDLGDGVEIILAAHAKLTLQFLSLLLNHGGRGGLETVEAVINDLRGGKFE